MIRFLFISVFPLDWTAQGSAALPCVNTRDVTPLAVTQRFCPGSPPISPKPLQTRRYYYNYRTLNSVFSDFFLGDGNPGEPRLPPWETVASGVSSPQSPPRPRRTRPRGRQLRCPPTAPWRTRASVRNSKVTKRFLTIDPAFPASTSARSPGQKHALAAIEETLQRVQRVAPSPPAATQSTRPRRRFVDCERIDCTAGRLQQTAPATKIVAGAA
jgi:hypothetical protein